MIASLVRGEPSARMHEWGIAALRMAVGITFLMHGWQKVFQVGIPGVAQFLGGLGIPAPIAAATLVALLELVGGAALLAGLFTRPVALALAIDMLVALLLVHLPAGFFVPNGIELVFVLLAGAVALALGGPGAFALDRLIARPRAGIASAGPDARGSVASRTA